MRHAHEFAAEENEAISFRDRESLSFRPRFTMWFQIHPGQWTKNGCAPTVLARRNRLLDDPKQRRKLLKTHRDARVSGFALLRAVLKLGSRIAAKSTSRLDYVNYSSLLLAMPVVGPRRIHFIRNDA